MGGCPHISRAFASSPSPLSLVRSPNSARSPCQICSSLCARGPPLDEESRSRGGIETFRKLRLGFSCNPHRRTRSRVQMECGHDDNPRGALIVLEGLDRSGKTSQSSRVISFLQGKGLRVEAWHFPDRSTSVGGMISSYLTKTSQLDDRTIHLLFSANRWEKSSLMETKLRSGTSLVVDRYSFSGVAFSAAKGLDIHWCKAPEEGLIAPDLVIFLDIPPEKAAERGGYGAERYECIEFQKKVAAHYHNLQDATWKFVDACLPVDDIKRQLRELALECISSCQKGKPLLKLWLNK